MAVIEVERVGQVGLVRLNRPDARNALNPELIVRLATIWEELAGDDDVRVVVITGAEGSTFCSGFDLASFIPLLTGAPMAAEQALAAGLVNRVVPADQVVPIALELAAAIAANAPLAVRAARAVVRASADLSESDALALERRRAEALARTSDAVEGPLAFLEKRPPRFEGR